MPNLEILMRLDRGDNGVQEEGKRGKNLGVWSVSGYPTLYRRPVFPTSGGPADNCIMSWLSWAYLRGRRPILRGIPENVLVWGVRKSVGEKMEFRIHPSIPHEATSWTGSEDEGLWGVMGDYCWCIWTPPPPSPLFR